MARFSLKDALTVVVVSFSTARCALAESSRRSYTVDRCASTKLNVAAELNQIMNSNISDSSTEQQVCLCFSSLQGFIEKNPEANSVVMTHGLNTVVDAFKKIIEAHSPNSCILPENAESACETSNLCAFTCKTPFVKSRLSNTCAIAASSSPTPSSKAKSKRGLEFILDAQSPSPCPSGHQLCPVWRRTLIMECVNTHSDLFSCGGCTFHGFEDERLVSGVDCSFIDGVSDVSCVAGKCRVRKCMKGWKVAENGTTCESVL